jgi:hypothetical protein
MIAMKTWTIWAVLTSFNTRATQTGQTLGRSSATGVQYFYLSTFMVFENLHRAGFRYSTKEGNEI